MTAPNLSEFEADLAWAATEADDDLSRRCRDAFHDFAKEFWPIVDDGRPIRDNWHIRAKCLYLQAYHEGVIATDLVINEPPGHAKSLIAAVLYPAWVWTRTPWYQFLVGTHTFGLALRDSDKCRRLIGHEKYQRLFVRGRWRILDNFDRQHEFGNSAGGYRVCIARGKGTGRRCHEAIVDDPIEVNEADSAAAQEEARRWIMEILPPRFHLGFLPRIVLVMQRLTYGDPSALLLKSEAVHLCLRLTARAETFATPVIDPVTGCPWEDPRRPGEVLFPQLTSPEYLEIQRRKLGSRFSPQYEQDPIDPADVIFKRSHWRFWRPPGTPVDGYERPDRCTKNPAVELPQLQLVLLSVDAAFDEGEATSFVVIQVWGAKGDARFLLEQAKRRMGFVDTVAAVAGTLRRWPMASTRLIEKKANGAAILNVFDRAGIKCTPVIPTESKVARAQAVSPVVERGSVHLPEGAEWLGDFVDELERFPKGEHNDQVDAMTQALNWLESSATGALRTEMLAGVLDEG